MLPDVQIKCSTGMIQQITGAIYFVSQRQQLCL